MTVMFRDVEATCGDRELVHWSPGGRCRVEHPASGTCSAWLTREERGRILADLGLMERWPTDQVPIELHHDRYSGDAWERKLQWVTDRVLAARGAKRHSEPTPRDQAAIVHALGWKPTPSQWMVVLCLEPDPGCASDET
jgi:hypothetical protein